MAKEKEWKPGDTYKEFEMNLTDRMADLTIEIHRETKKKFNTIIKCLGFLIAIVIMVFMKGNIPDIFVAVRWVLCLTIIYLLANIDANMTIYKRIHNIIGENLAGLINKNIQESIYGKPGEKDGKNE